MTLEDRIITLVREVLALPATCPLARDTALLGALPALDSVAVVALLAEIEDSLGLRIDDADLSAEVFATLGTLCDWVARQSPAVSS